MLKEFQARYAGTIGKPWDRDQELKYGILYEEINEACDRLCESYPEIISFGAESHPPFKILDIDAFLKISGLKPREPFADKQWITAQQLADMFPHFSHWELRDFEDSHPDAVYIPEKEIWTSTDTEFYDKFDPLRLRRKYLKEFKDEYNLLTREEYVLLTNKELKQAVNIQDNATLDLLLSAFGAEHSEAVVYLNIHSRHLRAGFLPQFKKFAQLHAKHYAHLLATRGELLTAGQILQQYSFAGKNLSLNELKEKIRLYVKKHPMAGAPIFEKLDIMGPQYTQNIYQILCNLWV